MTPELEALGRRAVACSGWKWMGGMQCWRGWLGPRGGRGRMVRVVRVEDGEPCGVSLGSSKFGRARDIHGNAESLPDFSDPATVGCLLPLVREAMGDSTICALAVTVDRWEAWSRVTLGPVLSNGEAIGGPTEAHALVAALEAAHG